MKVLMLGHGCGAVVGNQFDRIEELKLLGHEVECEYLYRPNTHPLDSYWHRLAVHVNKFRINAGPWVSKVNADLQRRSRAWKGFDLVWVEKAQYVTEATVRLIKEQVGCPIVHFTPDMAIAATGTFRSLVFHQAIPAYDALITTKDFEVELYAGQGAARVFLMEKSASHRHFYPRRDVRDEDRSKVGFIGRCERHYRNLIRHLAMSGIEVQARGPGWERIYRRLDPRYRAFNKGGAVRGERYALKLSGMEVGLGLLCKYGPEVVTARSIEIPACGTFLLAERTDKHQEIFQEGREAEFFGSPGELVDKAKYYLAHPVQRERIAAAGYRRFIEGPFRLDHQMKLIMQQISENFGIV